jgi:DNA-directed RNA polymerase specialized sigma subunit
MTIRINRLNERIQQLESTSEKVTSIITDMPRANNGNGKEDIYILLADTKAEYIFEIAEAEGVKRDIYKLIDKLDDERLKRLMELRYVSLKSWEDICYIMHYEWAQVHRLHSQALNILNDI